jgi:hypothetical protein
MTRCCWRGDCRTGDLSKREPELRAKHVSAFFEYRLINHLKLEDDLLFPAFRAVLGVEASLIDVLLSDHRELRAKAVAIKTGAHDQVDGFCVLLEHGLLRSSFVPPAPIRELRDLTRYRKSLTEERTRAANRLHKVLQDSGIKLSNVATDMLGGSGRSMLMALVSGTTDPSRLPHNNGGRPRPASICNGQRYLADTSRAGSRTQHRSERSRTTGCDSGGKPLSILRAWT